MAAPMVPDIHLNARDNTRAAFNSAAQNANRLNGSLRSAFRGMRGHTAQLGMQIQDVAVQLQGGTSAAIVFAQQGSQIASLFGPGGAVLGALLAVGTAIAGTLIPGMLRSRDASEDLLNEIKGLTDGYKDLTAAQQNYVRFQFEQKIAAQVEKVSDLEKQLAELQKTTNTISLGEEAFGTFIEDTDNATDEVRELSAAADNQRMILQSLRDTLANILNPELQKTSEEMSKVTAAINAIDAGISPATAALDAMDGSSNAAAAEAENLADALDQQKIAAHEAQKGIKTVSLSHLNFLNNAPKVTDQTKVHTDLLIENSEAAKETAKSMKVVNEELSDMERGVLRSVEDGLTDLVAGTKSVSEAFRSMARSVIQDLIRMQIRQQVTMPLFRMMNASNFTTVDGYTSVGSGGGVSAADPVFEGGGFTGRGSRSGGVDGRGGFPAILHPNETVVDHTQGQGQGGVTVNLNISTGVAQTVRAEIMGLMPQIANATKAAVAQERQRGGSFSAAMGT